MDTPPGDPGRDDAQEMLAVPACPCLDARSQHRCVLVGRVHVVRGTLDENAPALPRGGVDVVDLERHLVFRPAYPGTEVLVRRRSEEHTSELQSRRDLVCRLLLEKKK